MRWPPDGSKASARSKRGPRIHLMAFEFRAFVSPKEKLMSRYDEGILAPRTFTDHETDLLLRKTGERRGGFRDHLLFAIALGTGLREHEIVALNVGDFFDETGALARRLQLSIFKRSNDDENLQQVHLTSPRLRAKLEKFRQWKMRKGESVAPDAPLFVSRKSNRLSTRQVRRLIHV